MRDLHEINIQPTDKKAIKETSLVLKKEFPIDEVILFGSVARGQRDTESDIDILVLKSRSITWEERKTIIDRLFEIEHKFTVIFSPLIIEKPEWENGPFSILPIHRELERDGIST